MQFVSARLVLILKKQLLDCILRHGVRFLSFRPVRGQTTETTIDAHLPPAVVVDLCGNQTSGAPRHRRDVT